MKIISQKRCVIGEGPVWNEKEQLLYYTNGFNKEICKYNIVTNSLESVHLERDCAAIAFDKNNRIIVSQSDGVFALNNDGTESEIYDSKKYEIKFANDMKVGPDGRIYVGTQSKKRAGVGNEVDGKLYSIDRNGNVKVLIDKLQLSNGMEWSIDENFFYHTDSDTGIIKEYAFEKISGKIDFTGRQIYVRGVDGFTIDKNNNMYAACWGAGHIAVLDLNSMTIERYIEVPCNIPTSCCFAGKQMNKLVVTTASFGADTENDKNAGFTFIIDGAEGRKPYLFG